MKPLCSIVIPFTYNNDYKINLLVYSRHDSISRIIALVKFIELLQQFPISNYVIDSANDNYPTYELCFKWNINPFIDLNYKHKENSKYTTALSINNKGTPICIDNHEMFYTKFEKSRSRNK